MKMTNFATLIYKWAHRCWTKCFPYTEIRPQRMRQLRSQAPNLPLQRQGQGTPWATVSNHSHFWGKTRFSTEQPLPRKNVYMFRFKGLEKNKSKCKRKNSTIVSKNQMCNMHKKSCFIKLCAKLEALIAYPAGHRFCTQNRNGLSKNPKCAMCQCTIPTQDWNCAMSHPLFTWRRKRSPQRHLL